MLMHRESIDKRDHANVACGFHAGDPSIMLDTVRKCKEHKVKVGAHPGLPDIQGKWHTTPLSCAV